jgi:hypothetical protein
MTQRFLKIPCIDPLEKETYPERDFEPKKP